MASSSGNSSMFTKIQSSGSEEDLQLLMLQRKRKRMQSNRESARRSRMRKQEYLEDLLVQVGRLRKDNSEMLASLNITTQYYLNIEAQNSILRAQVAELSQRLQSLNEILNLVNTTTDSNITGAENFSNPRNMLHLNQAIMASANIFQW